MKNLTDFHTKVWICTWLLLYMLWSVVWLSPLRVAIKRLIQLSIIDDEHPPPPTSRDRMWYNWLWRVMQLLSRVCWKKVIFLLRIMLLYGAASLHWATTCWDPEGGKNRIKNSKSNIYRPFSGCARNGMCCHVAESICIKYIMFITVAKSTKTSTIIN